MKIEKLLQEAGMKQEEQALLEAGISVMEEAEESAEKREGFQKLQKPAKVYSARQKLFLELAEGRAEGTIGGQVGKYLFTHADAGLSARILLVQKSLEGCSRYIMEQAQKMARDAKKQALCVGDDVVFGWAEEYYRADNLSADDSSAKKRSGKENIRKLNRKSEAVSNRSAKERKAAGCKTEAKQAKSAEQKAAAEVKEKPEAKQQNEQISLFDLYGG